MGSCWNGPLGEIGRTKPAMFCVTSLHQPTRAGVVGFSLAVGAVVLAPLYLIVVSLWPWPAAEFAALTKGPFGSAALRSILQVGLVAALSLPLGMLIGLLFSLTNSHLRGLTFFVLLLPLMLPPFLWSIGWSSLRRFFAYRHQFWFDGLAGCLLTFATLTVPLVALATILTVRALSSTHLRVLRLAGGLPVLLGGLARYALPLAATVAVLGSIFAVADPGAAQIMGYHGAASTILIDFSARHDFHAAALKTCAFLFLLLPLVLLFGCWASSRVNAELLGADLVRYRSAYPKRWSMVAGSVAPVLALLTVLPPAVGVLWPLAGTKVSQILKFALPTLTGTAATTLFYCITAGLLASILGLFVALCAARGTNRRRWLLILACGFISIPPSLNALGLVSLTTHLPAQLDPLSRSGWIVGIGQGLRLMPICAALCLSSWCKIPQSLHQAAACHGVPLMSYLCRVGLPRMVPALVASMVIAGLLAAADVPSTMLLAPPGSITFPGRLFTVMDNASQHLVASLCLTYLLAGLVAAGILYLLCRRHWRLGI